MRKPDLLHLSFDLLLDLRSVWSRQMSEVPRFDRGIEAMTMG